MRNEQEALTILIVTISSYAWDDSPAIIPEPRRFSTPSPSSFPMMSVMMYLRQEKELVILRNDLVYEHKL